MMRVSGTLASAGIRWRQRPPVPIRPMLMRSFARSGWADAGSDRADVAATVAAEAVRNLRRERGSRFMGSPPKGLDFGVRRPAAALVCFFTLQAHQPKRRQAAALQG